MKEATFAIMFMIPWPHSATLEKFVIYTFPSEQACVESIPDVKRKHRLFFRTLGCVAITADAA
ncbi:MAG: hypothetical protein VX871_12640 [Pseudomonadota bacterium]|nr:hypothetical protein [Pseudomonadota bacterium]